jgi:hypothetical protein
MANAVLTRHSSGDPALVITLPAGVNFAEHTQHAVEALRILNNTPTAPASSFSTLEIAEQMQEAVREVTWRAVNDHIDLNVF